ncbi:MAG: trimethylamine methyltransferase family protein, partial [Deltaproteobacteria bacterium]
MSIIKPEINVLSQENREQLHQYSLQILSDVGIRVDFKKARILFAKKGFRVDDDHRVYIPRERVDWALTQAPSLVDIYNRKGKKAFKVGGGESGQTRFGVGVTNLFYQRPDNDQVEPFNREHMALAAGLGDTLNGFDLVATPGVLKDLPPEKADLFGTLEIAANTVKPMVLLVSNHLRFSTVLDMLAHLCGELAPAPFVIPYFNPITP